MEWLDKWNYLASFLLMGIGLWAMIVKSNIVKKVIGMSIFQTAIILFYMSISTHSEGTIPIVDHHGAGEAIYVNPLPHVLMLTAIVVGVGTLGVALALVMHIYHQHQSLEEPEIVESLHS